MPRVEHPVEARRITPEGRHFFFGYYDREPIDAGGRWHLALNVPFIDRPNTADDGAELGLIDIESGEWNPLDRSAAWNWQMGCSARWLGSDPGRKVIYNARRDGLLFARVLDVPTRWACEVALPLFDVSGDGRWGISVNFARIHACRPGYGYPGIDLPHAGEPKSASDGIFRVDLENGVFELIVSLAQCAAIDPESSMEGAAHWFNHVMISPGGERIMFLHRWRKEKSWLTRLFVCGPDGSGLRLLNRPPMTSHCDWRDDGHLLAWCEWQGRRAYHLIDVDAGTAEVVGEDVFSSDGHCHFRAFARSPDPRWFVTDTYPDSDRMRTLMLYDCETGTRLDIGRFLAPAGFDGEIRCDLHPRWDPTGTLLSIDSIHEGFRGIYLLDVAEIVGSGS